MGVYTLKVQKIKNPNQKKTEKIFLKKLKKKLKIPDIYF
jgi:hypothetical protein